VDQAGSEAGDDVDDIRPLQGFKEIKKTPDLLMDIQINDVPEEDSDSVFPIAR
jgi:hypothetical protein